MTPMIKVKNYLKNYSKYAKLLIGPLWAGYIYKKRRSLMKKGFTLIELLVVVLM